MKKLLALIFIGGIMQGCTVSTATPFWTAEALRVYQKSDQIGTTDFEQRGKDSMDCGALSPSVDIPGIVTPPPGVPIVGFYKDGRRQRWYQCMLDKGYIGIECGTDPETTLCK